MKEKEIGELIRRIRLQNKLSAKAFGRKYNVSFQAVARWERAEPLPEPETLKLICKDFNLDYKLLTQKRTSQPEDGIYIFLNAIPVLILLITIITFIIIITA